MPLEDLRARPAALPVPGLDQHVVPARQQQRGRGVDGDRPDVVGVRLEGALLRERVVVVDAHVRVVGARDDPLLARDELRGAHGQVGGLEAADEGAVPRVPDADGAVVEVGEEPVRFVFWFGWLSSVRGRREGAGGEVEEGGNPSREQSNLELLSHLSSSPLKITIIPYHGSVGCRSTPLTRSVRWEKRFCW